MIFLEIINDEKIDIVTEIPSIAAIDKGLKLITVSELIVFEISSDVIKEMPNNSKLESINDIEHIISE